TIEGKLTDKKLYSDTYPSNLVINPGEKIILVLPVSFTLNPTEGATMLIALSDGTAEYIVEGTFETVKVDDAAAVFKLPLYETGSVPISSIQEAD
ncbi:MAG: hypothetical protein U9Q83_11580, partial [Bacteroidota bacterium]|nr:hypothetical protein [Bacteroidota bacterium]